MRLGSLFAGIGGFDLAARWMGWTTAWVSEIEPYASRVLARHFPDAPNLGDITKITNPPPVDMLVGGFPCQDISLAGKGAGLDGERSGLWSHYARLIREVRPRWVVAENVSALRTRGLDRVLQDLDALGYDAEWHCIPASYVGAPHRRDRIWIVAYPNGQREHSCLGASGSEGSRAATPAGTVDADDAGCGDGCSRSQDVADPLCQRGASDVDDPICTGLEGHAWHDSQEEREAALGPTAPSGLPCGRNAAEWWASEPDVGRVAHGVPARVDRLRCLGNAIVPQVAYLIFRAIQAAEDSR